MRNIVTIAALLVATFAVGAPSIADEMTGSEIAKKTI